MNSRTRSSLLPGTRSSTRCGDTAPGNVRDHDMVEQPESDVTAVCDLPGCRAVGVRRGRVAAGVVVGEGDRETVVARHRAEHLPHGQAAATRATLGYVFEVAQPQPRIGHEHDQAFPPVRRRGEPGPLLRSSRSLLGEGAPRVTRGVRPTPALPPTGTPWRGPERPGEGARERPTGPARQPHRSGRARLGRGRRRCVHARRFRAGWPPVRRRSVRVIPRAGGARAGGARAGGRGRATSGAVGRSWGQSRGRARTSTSATRHLWITQSARHASCSPALPSER